MERSFEMVQGNLLPLKKEDLRISGNCTGIQYVSLCVHTY